MEKCLIKIQSMKDSDKMIRKMEKGQWFGLKEKNM